MINLKKINITLKIIPLIFFLSILIPGVQNVGIFTNRPADLNIASRLNGEIKSAPNPDDDWAEPNNYKSEAYELWYGYHTNFICLDDDWYKLSPIMRQEKLTIDLRFNTSLSLNIELLDDAETQFDYILKDQTWGKTLEFVADQDIPIAYLKIHGDYNTYYDMDMIMDGNNIDHLTPSYDWVAFTQGGWAEWDAIFTIIDSDQIETQYEGSLQGKILEMNLTEYTIEVDSEMIWEGIPEEFTPKEVLPLPEEDEPQEMGEAFPSEYHFSIDPEHYANPSYFGFASPFIGKNFQFMEHQPIFTLPDMAFQIGADAKSAMIEYNGTEPFYFKTIANYSDEGLLESLYMEETIIDEMNATIGIHKIDLNLVNSDLIGNVEDDNKSKGDENAFSLENIPSFSSELLLGVLGISLIGIIFSSKRKLSVNTKFS